MGYYNKKCVICGDSVNGDYLFCRDCYRSSMSQLYDIENEDYTPYESSSEYFATKDECFELDNIEDIKENILYLYALAYNHYNYFNSKLLDRVEDDILEILDNYKCNNKYNNRKSSFINDDCRNKWPKDYQCNDGHYVRSLSEKLIDDWLSQHNIMHSYEKSVFMATRPNEVVLCDFYLPNYDLYIEFWGYEDDEKYLKRKEYKIKLYDENNYRRLDLTEKDIKRLNDIMPRLLSKYEK